MGDDFEAWLESNGLTYEEFLALGLGLTGDKQLAWDASDLVIDQVLSMFWQEAEPSEPPKPSSFVGLIRYKFARAIGKLRKRAERLPVAYVPVEQLGGAYYNDPERAMQSSDLQKVFRDVLDGVQVGGVEVYEVVYLIDIQFMKQNAVAQRLGVSESTVSRAKDLAYALIRERRPELREEI